MLSSRTFFRLAGALMALAILIAPFAPAGGAARAQADDPTPPAEPVKLIFIHHSCGENWLTDDYGNLGRTLGQNNYFVSDTNYGWGPDSIGDRTDTLNWPEWFLSDQTPTYMDALFNESGQNSWYTRDLADPGGENQIIMFKSCFPNSNIDGSPNDPPAPGDDLTVGNAKYIYNSLLEYFVTRPDKLFIVITAPPVQDREYAQNARAFNTWLVQDWLRENSYPLNNVAVFDFYNVLTHPDNHHHYFNGQIEYITDNGNDTLYYDSDGDDHPNIDGSQKATDEFIPLLNVYYHRWAGGAPGNVHEINITPLPPNVDLPVPPIPMATQPGILSAPETAVIENFEGEFSLGSVGWEAFYDEAAASMLTCAPESGMASQGQGALHIQADIAPESWGSCMLLFDAEQDWRAAQGVAFDIYTDSPGILMNIDLFARVPDGSNGTYLFTLETTPEMGKGWVRVEFPWEFFLRANWEADAGTPPDLGLMSGIGFGFSAPQGAPSVGEVWIDEIQLWNLAAGEIIAPDEGSVPAPAPVDEPEPAPAEDVAEVEEEEPAAEDAGRRLCPGSMALGVGAVMLGLKGLRRKRS